MSKLITDPSDVISIVVGAISLTFLGLFIFVNIATTINPNAFVKNDGEPEPTTKNAALSDNLKLTSFKLAQHSYCYDDSNDCEMSGYGKRYSHVAEGLLYNNGDTIKAWSLHITFDIYEKDGDKVDGAYCVVWNDEDIPPESTWDFGALNNLDDCFAGIDAKGYFGTESVDEKQIRLSDFDIQYKSYDTKK